MASTPRAAHSVDIKLFELGDTTTLVAEATTRLSANLFQITDVARRILDPTSTFTMSDGTITAINYFEGIFTSSEDTTPTITSGKSVNEATELSSQVMRAAIALSRTVLDSTPFNLTLGDGNRRKQLGLQDVGITLGLHGEAGDDENIDIWVEALDTSALIQLLIQIDLLDTAGIFRAWMVTSNVDITTEIDDLIGLASTLVFHPQVSAQPVLAGITDVGFAFGS